MPKEYPDPWEGFGMDGETLEAKVVSCETGRVIDTWLEGKEGG